MHWSFSEPALNQYSLKLFITSKCHHIHSSHLKRHGTGPSHTMDYHPEADNLHPRYPYGVHKEETKAHRSSDY